MSFNHKHAGKMRLLASAAVAALLAVTPMIAGSLSPAAAQQTRVAAAAEFRTALEPFGRFRQHARWGEVWVPSRVAQDWRPYKLGRWRYTDDWGWYWASDEDFGWIVYHYGRWVYDDDVGWCWVPGNVWGPAWVKWRRGAEYVGWAPLPPDDADVVVIVDERPTFWFFVRTVDILAPDIVEVLIPRPRYTVFFEQTVIVNTTVIVDRGDYRIAVNPGVEPAYIAAARNRPIPVYNVRPVLLAGVAPGRIEGAVTVRADEARRARERIRFTRTDEVVRPADRVPPPQALKRGEEGRLGDRPPRAAREAARELREDRREQARERVQDRRERLREQREQTRERAKDDREQARERARDRRDRLREEREQTRERAQDRRQQLRDEREQARERREQARERQGAREQERDGAQERREQLRERRGQTRERRQEQRDEAREQRGRPRTTGRGPSEPERQQQLDRRGGPERGLRGPERGSERRGGPERGAVREQRGGPGGPGRTERSTQGLGGAERGGAPGGRGGVERMRGPSGGDMGPAGRGRGAGAQGAPGGGPGPGGRPGQ